MKTTEYKVQRLEDGAWRDTIHGIHYSIEDVVSVKDSCVANHPYNVYCILIREVNYGDWKVM